MLFPVYYTHAKYNALKAFIGLNSNDFFVLDLLNRLDRPCHYKGVYDLVLRHGNTIKTQTLSIVLRRCTEKGYVNRERVRLHVFYSITLEGKQVLHAFARELERIVSTQVKHSTRFDLT